MYSASIALFIVLLLLVVIVLVVGIFKSGFISKKNIFYLFPLLAINTALYSMAYVFDNSGYDSIAFFECLLKGIKSFAFEINRSSVTGLASKYYIFKVDIIFATALSGLTMVSTLIDFVKERMVNESRLLRRMLLKSPDVVCGDGKDGEIFAKGDSNAIYVLERNTNRTDRREVKRRLYYAKVPYISGKDRETIFKILLFFTKGMIHVFSFDEDMDKLNTMIDLIKKAKKKNLKRELRFHVLTDKDDMLFVNKMLTNACDNDGKQRDIMASAFNIYGLMGRKFSKTYTFAQFLPSDFYDGVTIKPEKNIHVVMLGFGKCANAILEASILNNQFVVKDDRETIKYKAKPIKYHLYDYSKDVYVGKLPLMFKDEAFENLGIDQTASICGPYVKDAFAKEKEYFDFGDDDFVFYFVSIGNSIHNITVANQISQRIENKKNAVVFYCVDSQKEVVDLKSDVKCLPFGFKSEVLTRDSIFDDYLCKGAEKVNDAYGNSKGAGQPFSEYDIVDKLSNLYSYMNVEFKLNLLGFTKDKNKAISESSIKKEEFNDVYLKDAIYEMKDGKIDIKYEDYFNSCNLNALIFQERFRWTTYYYLNDFSNMPLKDVTVHQRDGGKYYCVHKDIGNRKHACFIDFEGLDKLHRHETELLYKLNNMTYEEELADVETFKYDCMNLNEIATAFDVDIYRIR